MRPANFNEWVRQELRSLKITHSQAAEHLGISPTAFSTVLNGFHFGSDDRRKLTELIEKARAYAETAHTAIFAKED